MARPEKVKVVEETKAIIADSDIAIMADYRGLDVAEITELRNKLREGDTACRVIKNNLAKIACVESEVDFDEAIFAGPSLYVFGRGDVVFPAKVLDTFAKDHEALKIKGGFLEKKQLTAKEIKSIARLPSKEQLIAKLLGSLNSPIHGLVNVLSGPARNLVYALNSIKEQKEQKG